MKFIWRKKMKRILLWSLVLGCVSPGAFGETQRISVEDAIKYAIDHNFGLQALKAEVEAKDASIGVARSKFFPKLGVVGGGEYMESNSVVESGALGYAFGQWNLFNGFADGMAKQKAEIAKQIAESEYRKSAAEVRLEVESLFNRYLYKRNTLEHIHESIALNEKHLQSVRRRMSAGLTSESDQMDFELRDAVLRSDSRLNEQELVEIKLGLVRMMGPELGLSFEPSGQLAHYHVEGDLNEYLQVTHSSNEEIKQSLLGTESALLDLRQSRSAWMPSLDAEVKFGVLPLDERVGDKTPGVSGMLVARWELFSGFGTKALSDESSAMLRKKELESRQTLLTSMAGVENLIRKLHSIEERVDLEKTNEDRALRLYRLTLSEYSRGVKNSSDVKAAEQSLLDAKNRASGYKNEFLETKLELEKKHNVRVRVREMQDSHLLSDHAKEGAKNEIKKESKVKNQEE